MRPADATERSATVWHHAMATDGFLPEDEAEALFAVAARAAASHLGPLLEIGAYKGRSTLVLAAGILTAKRPEASTAEAVTLFSVDHHRGSEELQAGWPDHDPGVIDPNTGRMETLPFWRKAIAAAGVEDFVVGVVGDSARVAASWSTPLGLVFVDGGHGEEVEWADYRGFAPHVAAGGLLVFHDVFENEADGGRPPYECYRDAIASGSFVEETEASRRSLRVLRRERP
jgi:predicted O-methyltransferase YrrM